jgi:ubiquinone/menaquinone biosynthesis C-methylase UbiE
MMTDWDASRYHRISDPQFEWGTRVIARLALVPGERVLDLGCGTGRLTRHIASAVGGGAVVGLDRSSAMLEVAKSAHRESAPRAAYVLADGAALPFHGAFDAVFSAATLHWIHDHEAVFAGVFRALRPGGRFVAQCGGAGNLARLLDRTGRLMASAPYAGCFREWHEPWNFADVPETSARLARAGFRDIRTWIEEAPVALGDAVAFAEFVSCVCIRHHLHRLPPPLRDPFVGTLTDEYRGDPRPFVLDYRRLNVDARKAAR